MTNLIQRRAFLVGLTASLFAAPAIVRAASLMPIKGVRLSIPPDIFQMLIQYDKMIANLPFAEGHRTIMLPPRDWRLIRV